MKQVLNVEVLDYKITISDESFSKFFDEIITLTSGKKRLFVVSKNVFNLYKTEFNLSENEVLVLKDGEKEKNFKNYLKILEKATQIGLTRSDAIIAIGGGVIGDIAGFAASTYMRGIDYIQVPTTLLAMVDSSVGGKTAIDMFGAKNIVGTFYQPKAVFININFLKTLDKKQFRSGLGEILKYAFIENNCEYKHSLFMFEYLTLCCEKLIDCEPITIMRVIEYCLNLKISVVIQDEKEGGLRKILNFGHTLGHALEARTKFNKFTHGEAVVYGMFFVLNWAYAQNRITYSYYRLSIDLLTKYGFKPLDMKKFVPAELIDIMRKDKKASGEKISFIVPSDKKSVKEIKLTPEEVAEMFFQIK